MGRVCHTVSYPLEVTKGRTFSYVLPTDPKSPVICYYYNIPIHYDEVKYRAYVNNFPWKLLA